GGAGARGLAAPHDHGPGGGRARPLPRRGRIGDRPGPRRLPLPPGARPLVLSVPRRRRRPRHAARRLLRGPGGERAAPALPDRGRLALVERAGLVARRAAALHRAAGADARCRGGAEPVPEPPHGPGPPAATRPRALPLRRPGGREPAAQARAVGLGRRVRAPAPVSAARGHSSRSAATGSRRVARRAGTSAATTATAASSAVIEANTSGSVALTPYSSVRSAR